MGSADLEPKTYELSPEVELILVYQKASNGGNQECVACRMEIKTITAYFDDDRGYWYCHKCFKKLVKSLK